MNLLKLTHTGCCNNSSIQSRSIMTDDGSALVKVTSNMDGYHHCLCSFHINSKDLFCFYLILYIFYLITLFIPTD